MEQAIIDRLVKAVDKFTSLKDFISSSSHSKDDHMEYRASLYWEMCEALREYNIAKNSQSRLTG
jgi:hypothetical protein